MYTETEGIVLRQIKTVNARRMVRLFSQKYGKISAGTGLNERNKGKSTLAMKPFTVGRYELFKNRNNYNINKAETVKSYYAIGENVDKYMVCSYVLEWTEKALIDDSPAPAVYKVLIEFLEAMLNKKKDYDTLVLAYQVKVIKILGNMPELSCCSSCGGECKGDYFDVPSGGIVCSDCVKKISDMNTHKLIYRVKFDIVNTLKFFEKKPLVVFQNIGLKQDVLISLKCIIAEYSKYYLDIDNLKSEEFLK